MEEPNIIVVFGASGMLGHDLHRTLGLLDIHVPTHTECDISDPKHVIGYLHDVQPNVVYNCAAYTNVDAAEGDWKSAAAVNTVGAANIAEGCKQTGAFMVQVSTDYVFDGCKSEPYLEKDQQNAINAYGSTKMVAEWMCRNTLQDLAIVRTSWLFGENGKNFVTTILNAAKTNPTLQVVNDQHGSPTYTKDLAKALKNIGATRTAGIFHVTNSGYCTWYDFASKILGYAGLFNNLEDITTDEYPRPARRPMNSRLTNTKLPPLRPWEEALKEYVEKIMTP